MASQLQALLHFDQENYHTTSTLYRVFALDLGSIFHLSCWGIPNDFYIEWVTQLTVLPLTLLMLVLLRYTCQRRSNPKQAKETMQSNIGTVIFFVYTEVCYSTFVIFNCRKLTPNLSVLAVNYSVECSGVAYGRARRPSSLLQFFPVFTVLARACAACVQRSDKRVICLVRAACYTVFSFGVLQARLLALVMLVGFVFLLPLLLLWKMTRPTQLDDNTPDFKRAVVSTAQSLGVEPENLSVAEDLVRDLRLDSSLESWDCSWVPNHRRLYEGGFVGLLCCIQNTAHTVMYYFSNTHFDCIPCVGFDAVSRVL